MDYRVITDQSPPEDKILANSPEKIAAFESEPFFPLYQSFLDEPQEQVGLHSLLFRATSIIETASAQTKNLVLFTSDRRAEAEQFVLDNPDHDLIHTTPMGYMLEKLKLFSQRDWGKLGSETAYAFWNMAAVRLINETTSKDIKVFANLENKSSTFWMLEVPCMRQNPDIQNIHIYAEHAGDTPDVLTRKQMRGFENPQLLEWLCLFQKSFETDERLSQEVLNHPMGQKYLKDTSLNANDLEAVRDLYFDTMMQGWQAFSKKSENTPANIPDTLSL